MAPARLLERNIRPPRHDQHDRDARHGPTEEGLSESKGEESDSESDSSSTGNRSESERDDALEGMPDDGNLEIKQVPHQISNVSFEALLEAQNALSKKRKRGSDTTTEQDAKLQALRSRLQEIKSSAKSTPVNHVSASEKNKATKSNSTSLDRGWTHPGAVARQSSDEHEANDSDSAPSEEAAPAKSRTSKHAPMSQSTKHQVTRRRTVIDVPKRAYRDPRFDALQQSSAHSGNNDKAYSFLQDYQKDEIAELKSALKKARTEEDKDTLRRQVVAMENRLKAKEAKDREQEVLRRHRKEEREKVEQGKKPYFLKEKDVKERALVEKFKGMKSKDRTKLIEKRRRKEGQKEKKRMPEPRRLAG